MKFNQVNGQPLCSEHTKNVIDRLCQNCRNGENCEHPDSVPQESYEWTVVRCQEEHVGATSVLQKLLRMIIEEVINLLIDRGVLIGIDLNHLVAAGLLVALEQVVESCQTLQKRFPKIKNWNVTAVIIVIVQLLTQQVWGLTNEGPDNIYLPGDAGPR